MATIPQSVGRNSDGSPSTCVDVCYSPDESIWYLLQWDFNMNRSRMSQDFISAEKARRAYLDNEVKWEAWL